MLKLYREYVLKYLNGKYFSLLLLCLFSIGLMNAFGARTNFNFWSNLVFSLQDSISIALFFCIIILSVFIYKNRSKKDYLLLNRIGSYKEKIKTDLTILILISLILFLAHIIINIFFSIIISKNDFHLIFYKYYKVPILIYLFIHILKFGIYTVLITILTYLLSLNKKTTFIALLLMLVNLLNFSQLEVINIFSEFNFVYSYYLVGMEYSSFNMEITFSIINIIIYILIGALLYNRYSRRKVDIN